MQETYQDRRIIDDKHPDVNERLTMKTSHITEKANRVISLESKAIQGLQKQPGIESLPEIADLIIRCTGHVLVAGAGTSRTVASRFAHLLACCGTPALPLNAADALHGGAGAIKKEDLLFIISKGGMSREINRLAEIAKTRGAAIIAQTENPDSPLGKISDAVYCIKAPVEIDPYGMIATGSSLLNSAAGDILCWILLEMREYTKDQFALTHPEGAVGQKLDTEKRGSDQ